jgi:hypothetical protein
MTSRFSGSHRGQEPFPTDVEPLRRAPLGVNPVPRSGLDQSTSTGTTVRASAKWQAAG